MSTNPFLADPRLIAKHEAVALAKADYEETLEEVQSDCEHRLVVQSPQSGHRDNYRICARCRLVEQGSHWSYGTDHWSRHDYGQMKLGNQEDRIVVQMTAGDWWRWRDDPAFTSLNGRK